MRILISIFLAIVMIFSFVSCNSTTDENDTAQDQNGGVYAEWIVYNTLSEINSSADCLIVAEVLSKGDAVSVGYKNSDFDNFEEKDTHTAAMMKLSIRTPYEIKINEIISSKMEISEGDTVALYQIGGTIGEVTLNDASTAPLEVGSEYVFILNKHTTDDSVTYYYMVTPFQGYAKIEKSRTLWGTKTAFVGDEDNHLFDSVTSISDIRKAIETE